MKIILVISLFICSQACGQRHNSVNDEVIIKGDSLEMIYKSNGHLGEIKDTLPGVMTNGFDENNAWRRMQLITYFYDIRDSSKKLIKAVVLSSQFEYIFYFEGVFLRKTIARWSGGLINGQYYYTDDDNQMNLSDIDKNKTDHPERKELLELLLLSRQLSRGFKVLL